ncbi:VapE domain-containing protein [Methylobacterium sp. UNCCL110]|uniref:phage NrS-1 polymerase family protein n=4 Tax=Bacteria TaxID=2 RepID=UPI000AE25C30|nr:VapE domain-containing protein [Methylobacterium sp. UNCCL110]
MTLFKEQNFKEPNFQAIPQELKNHPKWMVWKVEPKPNKPNELGKVPYNLKGYRASKSDPKNWITFEQAKTAYEKGGFDGIGVVINRNDSLVCIDIDDIEDISKAPDFINQSYTELSPSEKGLHLWVRGQKPEWVGTKQNGIEMYGNEKESFLTVTGNIFINKPVMANQTLIMSIAEKYFPNQKPQEEQPKQQQKKVIKFKQVPDNVVLNKMFDSKNGDEIKNLFNGDISNYCDENGRPDPSRADQALSNHLAYWTNNDSEQMDRLFKKSGLYREKWNRTDYVKRTIKKAIDGNQSEWDRVNESKRSESNESNQEQETTSNEPDSWKDDLEYSEKGFIKRTSKNIELILDNVLGDSLAWDEFSSQVTLQGDLPWRKLDPDNTEWKSHDWNQLEHWLGVEWEIYGKAKIENAFVHITQKRSFHQIKSFIESVQWDGEIRVPTLFIDYLGAEDSEYTREITKRWLTGAVKRIYSPGCQFEIMPILVGAKGIGKSVIGYKLANEKWFTDSLINLDPKISGEILADNWICEFPEMKAFKNKSDEEIKMFISSKNDKYRGAYERGNATDHKRHSVFYGTSNRAEILTDETGERRRFPIKCNGNGNLDPFKDLTPETISQVWAETKYYYDMGYLTWIDKDLQQVFEQDIFRDFQDIDPLQDEVQEYAEAVLTAENRVHLCEREIWDKVVTNDLKNKPTKRDSDRIKAMLLSLGYERIEKKQKCGEYGSRRAYMKK